MKEFYNNFHVHVDVWRTNYCYAHAAKSKKMFPTCSLQWIRSNHLSFSFFLRDKIIYALINANNQFIPTKNRLEIEKSIQKKKSQTDKKCDAKPDANRARSSRMIDEHGDGFQCVSASYYFNKHFLTKQ